MALALQATQPSGAIRPTSVHPQETSGSPRPWQSYKTKIVSSMRLEYEITDETYHLIDLRDHKFRCGTMMLCRSDAWLAVNLITRTVSVVSSSCRLRWCPICSRAKAVHIAEGVTEWLETHKRPKLLTLTLKHSSDSLDKQVTRLYACFRTLRKQKYYRDNIHGGIWFFQVKWIEQSQSWHPHLHCLLDSEYLPHAVLKRTWKAITGDSDVVDIRVIRSPKHAAEYVARYAARPALLADLPYNKRIEIMDSLHSRRLCGKWGSASEINFRGKNTAAVTDYKPIAYYSRMHQHCRLSAWARLLWDCYRTGNPVPMCWDLEAIDGNIQTQICGTPVAVEPDPQLFLPFESG